jgi:hypothetical protein
LQKERDANDITKEERNKILQGVENYPLPEGVFFNGSKYVNWEGETLKEHPCMPQMIEDFLKNELVGNCPFPAMRALPAQPCTTLCDTVLAHVRLRWVCRVRAACWAQLPSLTEVDLACAEVARCNQEIKEMQAAYERELASCLATAVKAVSQGS